MIIITLREVGAESFQISYYPQNIIQSNLLDAVTLFNTFSVNYEINKHKENAALVLLDILKLSRLLDQNLNLTPLRKRYFVFSD